MDRLAAYNKLNRSFQKKYIFNFGSEGGFYSEFNNMVFGMIYCLKYKYRFVLYSENSKFKMEKGWDDFFEPFCDTVQGDFHKRFNKRMEPPQIKLKNALEWYLFRLFSKNFYLTYELFNLFFNKDFEQEQFDFPELGLKGNLRDVSREIVKMIYRFNEPTEKAVRAMVSGLNLPVNYASVNIRRGDKDTEFSFMPTDVYMNKLADVSTLTDVFVLTDDYTVMDHLEEKYPHIQFYTLANKEERGYIHSDFAKQDISKKENDLIKLFASLEVMRHSHVAVGTFTTNPGTFLGMTMPEDRFVSVQKKSWYQFEEDDVQDYIVK